MAVIRGTAAADSLVGTAASDTLHLFGGADRAYGGSGNDRLYGGNDGDTLSGGSGNDLLFGGTGNNRGFGGAGGDRVYGDTGIDRLYGGDDNDRLYGGNDSDYLFGGWGNDLLYAGTGNDRLYGDYASDRLYGGSGANRLYGGGANDVLAGREGTDRLYGGDGNDRLLGEDGADLAWGGVGRDRLYGGDDGDSLSGNAGRDWLYGGDGNDRMRGGAGGDFLYGGAGNDRLEGGLNLDVAYYTGERDGYVVVTSGAVTYIRDADTSDGDDGRDVLLGVERLRFRDETVTLGVNGGGDTDGPPVGGAVGGIDPSGPPGGGLDGEAGLYIAGSSALWVWDGTTLEPLTEGLGGGTSNGGRPGTDPSGPPGGGNGGVNPGAPPNGGGGGPIIGAYDGGLYLAPGIGGGDNGGPGNGGGPSPGTNGPPAGNISGALFRLDAVNGDLELVGGVDNDGAPNIHGITEGLIIGDTLYASADGYADVGRELYSVDLTTGEVELEADFLDDGSSSPRDLVETRGALFFQAVAETASGGSESLLHAYNPVNGNGTRVEDHRTDPDALGRAVTADDDFIYFAADPNGPVGQGLYRVGLDSASPVVTRLVDPTTRLDPTDVHHLTWYKGKLYFGGEAAGFGDDLFSWDPATNKLSAVGLIMPGPFDMLATENALYYLGNGTSANTDGLYAMANPGFLPTRVFDLETLSGYRDAQLVGTYQGDLFLSIERSATGAELYRYDPVTHALAPAGTSLPGSLGDFPLTGSDGAFVF